MAQWTECCPAHQRVASSIPSRRTCLGCGSVPGKSCLHSLRTPDLPGQFKCLRVLAHSILRTGRRFTRDKNLVLGMEKDTGSPRPQALRPSGVALPLFSSPCTLAQGPHSCEGSQKWGRTGPRFPAMPGGGEPLLTAAASSLPTTESGSPPGRTHRARGSSHRAEKACYQRKGFQSRCKEIISMCLGRPALKSWCRPRLVQVWG